MLICQVPDTGSFTIPASTFALIPPEYRRAGLVVSRVSKTEVIAGDTRVMVAAASSIVAAAIELSGVPHVPQPPTPAQPSPVQPSSVQPSACIPREPPPRGFVSLAFGTGELSRVGTAAPTNGDTERVQFGQRLAHGLMLVEEWNLYGSGEISQSPATSEYQMSFGAGIRWLPFERSSVPRLRGPYLTATAGLAGRTRETVDLSTGSNAWAPMASLAVGLQGPLPFLRGRDWAIGEEFREQVARFDGQLQRGAQLLIVLTGEGW